LQGENEEELKKIFEKLGLDKDKIETKSFDMLMQKE